MLIDYATLSFSHAAIMSHIAAAALLRRHTLITCLRRMPAAQGARYMPCCYAYGVSRHCMLPLPVMRYYSGYCRLLIGFYYFICQEDIEVS